MIIGNIDKLTSSAIQGWAADKSEPNTPVILSLYINNELIGNLSANIMRGDIKKAIGTGAHGFFGSLEDKLAVGMNTIKLVIEQTGETFAEKTFTLDSDPKSKVERGLDGWLFLKNDSNNSIDVITGKILLTEEQVTSYLRIFYNRKLLSKEHNFTLVNYIIPDKGVVCNKYRTPCLAISETRPAIQILNKAKDSYSVKYPLELCKKIDNFYFKTDTHPSFEGQQLLFNSILSDLGIIPSYSTQNIIEQISGDLGSKLQPQEVEKVSKPLPQFFPTTLTDSVVGAFANGTKLTGTWTRYCSNVGLPKKILVVGTSTAFYLREFFFSQFQEVIFCWHTALDLDTILEFQPDYVVTLLTERFLIQVPKDNETKYCIF